ncbi:MAG: nucleotidyltransferase substrate binding protein [Alistipes senegalensis]|nr:nucleotidyltransferase substrate binding protein [Oxalobacter formigenes]MCM1280423.1 nucleotidyltransferase substrate binding protein [Alistipes senegalensis]
MKKFENFCRALNNLQIIRDTKEPYDILTIAGGVALFGICFEQAWKAMKAILADQGYSAAQTCSPKQILKLAYSAKIVQDEDKWLAILASRNEISHSYNEEIALGLMRTVKADYIGMFEALKTELEKNWL